MKSIFSLILFSSLFLNQAYCRHAPVISVRIGKSLKNILVSGLDLKRHLVFNNDFKKFQGKQTVKFNCETLSSLNPVKNRPVLLATLESSNGLLFFGPQKYAGQFKVITSPKGDSCDIVNDVPMETYLATLLSKEMHAHWPTEALKAQAVAARTYAIHKMQTQQVTKELGNEAYYDLESSEKHQVGGAWADVSESTIEASLATKGEVLLNSSKEIGPIFFHSKCGGRTLRPDQVWKNKEEGYQSVNCPFCHNIGPKAWNNHLSFEQIRSFILWSQNRKELKTKNDNGISSQFKSVLLVPDSQDKYSLKFYINDRPIIIDKAQLRKYFGNVLFPSNTFSLQILSGGFSVNGEGLGHGVGLCQMGTYALAMQGWSYKKILSHYFPGHQLRKLY